MPTSPRSDEHSPNYVPEAHRAARAAGLGLLSLLALTAAASGRADDGSGWTPYGDFTLRFEHTSGIPGNRPDIERVRARLRAGVLWLSEEGFEFGAAVKGRLGSDSNRTNLANLDNEKSDAGSLDELYLRYDAGEHLALQAGKTRLPMQSSPLVWDGDLRPIGVSAEVSGAAGAFSTWFVRAGYFRPDHEIGAERSELGVAQIGMQSPIEDGVGFDVWLSYWVYHQLERIAPEGLARTNRRVGPGLLSDYRLAHAQVSAHTRLGERPLVARLDLVDNLGARDQDKAARASLVWGNADEDGPELGFAYQRPQRDAVLAAFAEDDWWFHSFARGGMPWIAYGWDARWRVQLTGFIERRDGLRQRTERVLLDVAVNW